MLRLFLDGFGCGEEILCLLYRDYRWTWYLTGPVMIFEYSERPLAESAY